MRTFSPRAEDIERRWWLVDATDISLGRLASRVAVLLRGKHKPIFAPHMDTGDHVIIVNAERVAITGNKRQDKVKTWYSGYPGGGKSINWERLMAKRPERVVELAVKGMLPRTKLGRQLARKLKVYAGAQHPHEAQQPVPYALPERRRELRTEV